MPPPDDAVVGGSARVESYKFALVSKELENPYWKTIQAGCLQGAALLRNVECLFVGPAKLDATEQYQIAKELLETNAVDGMSFAVIDTDHAKELAEIALERNIPFITVDSDAVDSKRLVYIGTDNFSFGESLAKVLLQIRPEGGKYGIISELRAPNLIQRAEGVRHRLSGSLWVEDTENSPKDCRESNELALQQMYELVDVGVGAIIPVAAWPMRIPDEWAKFVDSHKYLWNVVGDMDPVQLDLISKKYVHGLVGQVPYEMGSASMNILTQLQETGTIDSDFFKTGLIEVIQVPLDLPDVNVDLNQLGGLRYAGFSFFGVVSLTSIGFILWTIMFRERRVIKASQPAFLVMVAVGVLILGSAMIPMSFDEKHNSQRACQIACVSVMWLVCIGFTITFSALFSKTWRINRIFRRKQRFKRKQVKELDVLIPFVVLMSLNIALLALWTAISPISYTRQEHEGTDLWNRVISTYGGCVASGGSEAIFGALLGVINIGLLVLSLVQAYKARSIQSEFSESKYIALSMLSLLQTCVIGIPILFLVRDQPQAFYMVGISMIFINCLSILLLIFLPKVKFLIKYQGTAEENHSSFHGENNDRRVIPKSSFYEGKSTGKIRRSVSWKEEDFDRQAPENSLPSTSTGRKHAARRAKSFDSSHYSGGLEDSTRVASSSLRLSDYEVGSDDEVGHTSSPTIICAIPEGEESKEMSGLLGVKKSAPEETELTASASPSEEQTSLEGGSQQENNDESMCDS